MADRDSRGQYVKVVLDEKWVESKVTPITESGCWIWNGYIASRGYGTYRQNGGKNWLAHRLVYAIMKGALPEKGKDLMHSCDERSCVNPAHLSVGTRRKNLRDMVDRNRQGIGVFKQKVSDVIKAEIKRAKGAQKDIAALYGVHPSLVSRIKSGTDTNRTRFPLVEN